jgi:hypothetical protein
MKSVVSAITSITCISKVSLSMSVMYLFLCCSPILAPHTKPYHPYSEWEVDEYKKANVNIFPDDVRKDINTFKDTVIAWPGIIQTQELKRYEDKVDVELVLEHHFYDWLEDYGLQKEKIFLSPQGEGLFTTIWSLRSDVNLEEWNRMVNIGDLAIVYGYPDSINLDSIISIRSTYIRSFPRDYYCTDILDYDRVYLPAEKKYLLPLERSVRGEMCCMGCLGFGTFGALASLSYLSFGDEILGGFWACGALGIGVSMFSHESMAPGPAMAIPLALGCGVLSYYNFAYGDERSNTEVFLVNALSPVGLTVITMLCGAIFPSHAFKVSNKFNLKVQQNSIKISMMF